MDSLYLRRARTEIDSAEVLFQASENTRLKIELRLDERSTFYSGSISHAYYAIFYAAKAMLERQGIKTASPDIHLKTYEAFRQCFIETGILDAKLLIIYRKLAVRAETLLEIFRIEKAKRGRFTYQTIPQANREPAKESIRNAKFFFRHCEAYLS